MSNWIRVRTGRKSAAALALAVAAAMVAGAVAVAAPNGNQSSIVSFDPEPNVLPENVYRNASIQINTHTDYDTSQPAPPGGWNFSGNRLDRVRWFIDDDFRFVPNAVPTCHPNEITNLPMEQAMNICGDAKVNGGVGRVTTFSFGAGPSGTGSFYQGCVLLFNGTSYQGDPNIVIYTRLQLYNPSSIDCTDTDPPDGQGGNATVVHRGIITDAPADLPDFGKKIDVEHLGQAATVHYNWSDLRFTIKRAGYFQGRCHDVSTRQNLRVVFGYRDGQFDVDTAGEDCTVDPTP